MAMPLPQPISPKEYLRAERLADTRHELVDGKVLAMAGASLRHGRLVVNLSRHLSNALDGSGCGVLTNDMRVHAPVWDSYFYPDLVLFCGDGEWLDDEFDTLLNPLAVIEVLSPSTEAYDRGKKFQHYKLIPSIRHFVFVSQEDMSIDAFERMDDGNWRIETLGAPEDVLQILNAAIPLHLIYDRVL